MKKIPILICLLALIGLGVGCNLKKDDQQVLKDKFRVLKPIYPTDKIEGLFSRFPKGFKILNIRNEKGERIEIELDGDPQTKKITGYVMEKKLRSGEPDLEILNKEIYYQDGDYIKVPRGTELRMSVSGDFDADAKGKFKKYIRVWKIGLGKSVFEMIGED